MSNGVIISDAPYTVVRVIKVLPNNKVLCSDGVVRAVACSRRLSTGERVVVREDLVYGHEWRKPAPVLEVKEPEFLPCPEGAILLIVRISDGSRAHKYFFCMTLEAEPAIVELSGLQDPRLVDTGLDNVIDLEVSAGVIPSFCQGFNYIVRGVGDAQKTYVLLSNSFYQHFEHYFSGWSIEGYAERRPFWNTNPDYYIWNMSEVYIAWPWPNPYLFQQIVRYPIYSQVQDFHLDASIFGNVKLTQAEIEIISTEIDVHDDITNLSMGGGQPVGVIYHKPAFKRYDYNGEVLSSKDLNQMLGSFYSSGYPYDADADPVKDTVYTPLSIVPSGSNYLLFVAKNEVNLFGHKSEKVQKLLWTPGNALPSFVAEKPEHYQNSGPPGNYYLYYSDDIYLTGVRTFVWQYDAPSHAVTRYEVWRTGDTLTLYFYDLTIVRSGYIDHWLCGATTGHTELRRYYTCGICPLGWHRQDGKTYLVYANVVVSDNYNNESDGSHPGYLHETYFENTVKASLKATGLVGSDIELKTLEGEEIKSVYGFLVRYNFDYIHDLNWAVATWGCSGTEVRDISLSVFGDKLLVSYLVVRVVKYMNDYESDWSDLSTSYELSETILERVFAFYDLPTETLIWRGEIDLIPKDERATVGFLMSP